MVFSGQFTLHVQQRSGEPIADYLDRVLGDMNRVNGVTGAFPEAERAKIVLRGLLPHRRTALHSFCASRGIASLSELEQRGLIAVLVHLALFEGHSDALASDLSLCLS